MKTQNPSLQGPHIQVNGTVTNQVSKDISGALERIKHSKSCGFGEGWGGRFLDKISGVNSLSFLNF